MDRAWSCTHVRELPTSRIVAGPRLHPPVDGSVADRRVTTRWVATGPVEEVLARPCRAPWSQIGAGRPWVGG